MVIGCSIVHAIFLNPHDGRTDTPHAADPQKHPGESGLSPPLPTDDQIDQRRSSDHHPPRYTEAMAQTSPERSRRQRGFIPLSLLGRYLCRRSDNGQEQRVAGGESARSVSRTGGGISPPGADGLRLWWRRCWRRLISRSWFSTPDQPQSRI